MTSYKEKKRFGLRVRSVNETGKNFVEISWKECLADGSSKTRLSNHYAVFENDIANKVRKAILNNEELNV